MKRRNKEKMNKREIAQLFNITMDELFDLTVDQRLHRIEKRLDIEEEFPNDIFREYESFLKEQLGENENRTKILSLLAHLYHHRMEADSRARRGIWPNA